MTELKSDQAKPDAKAARNARREQLHAGRTRQLQSVRSAIPRIEEQARAVQKNARVLNDLSSHLKGFYEEIDKLTKGKALIPVTDLIVERVNDIVRDAKSIVQKDTYLERVKEFVPAGDNPVYPDVLLTARTIQASLERFKTQLESEKTRIFEALGEARTLEVSLEIFLRDGEIPDKAQVEDALGEDASQLWFPWDANRAAQYFDVGRLDRTDIDRYFSGVGGA